MRIDRYACDIEDERGNVVALSGWIVFIGPFVLTIAKRDHSND